MEKKTDSTVIVSNFVWNLLERWGAQGVTFIVSVILARVLEPTVYGLTALASVFSGILGVFIDSGLGSALVQKKDADEIDFSTVFYFNVAMCIILYFIMFFLSPVIAAFYEMPELIAVIRVSSLSLIISGFKNILISVIQKNLQYKKFFFSTLAGTILAAIVGIFMAFNGFGVWALVIQGILNSTVDTFVLWFTVGWRPKAKFSFQRLVKLLPFGSRILGTTLINTIYSKLRDLIIGKKYTTQDLAYYNKASGWPNLLFVNLGGAIDSVMFPVMSKAQEDKAEVKKIMSRTIRLNTYVVFPMLVGLALCAESAVSIVLTEKWIPIVEYMRVFCFVYAISTIDNTQRNMIRSIGRSDWFLRLETTKRGIDLIALIISMQISVKAMAYSLILTNIVGLIINMWIVNKLLEFNIYEQIKDFFGNIILSITMAIPVIVIGSSGFSDVIKLMLQIVVGVVTYILLSILLKSEAFSYILAFVKTKLAKPKKQKYE